MDSYKLGFNSIKGCFLSDAVNTVDLHIHESSRTTATLSKGYIEVLSTFLSVYSLTGMKYIFVVVCGRTLIYSPHLYSVYARGAFLVMAP